MAQFTPEYLAIAHEIISRYPVKKSALIPLLHLAQEQTGHITEEAMAHIAELVEVTPAEVLGTCSFYEMFKHYPAMTPIWEATRADQYLKEIDRQDVEQHAQMLAEAYRRAAPGLPARQVVILSGLATELIACAVRHAITLDEAHARESLQVFKQGLRGFFAS